VDDARFVAVFAHSLEHSGVYTAEEARRVASTLLPDIMCFDHTRPASYPRNSRTLTDDALDHFLTILTNGKVTTDGVGAHNNLLAESSYLGPPHKAAAAGAGRRNADEPRGKVTGGDVTLEMRSSRGLYLPHVMTIGRRC